MSAGHMGRENIKKHGHKGNNGTRWRHGLRQRLVHYRFIIVIIDKRCFQNITVYTMMAVTLLKVAKLSD